MDHDIIFGVQNIVEGERRAQDRLLPVADYAKPGTKIFQDWAKRLMAKTRLPYFLFIFENRSTYPASDLPSWLPDLRVNKHRALFNDHLFTPERLQVTWDTAIENSHLFLEGPVLGTIKEEAKGTIIPSFDHRDRKTICTTVQYASPDEDAARVRRINGEELWNLLRDFSYVEYDCAHIPLLSDCFIFIPASAQAGDILVGQPDSSLISYLLRSIGSGRRGRRLLCRFIGPTLNFYRNPGDSDVGYRYWKPGENWRHEQKADGFPEFQEFELV